MCSAIKCPVCGKTTWAGCGRHIAQVKASAAPGNWCDGNHTDAEKAAAKSQRRGIFGF